MKKAKYLTSVVLVFIVLIFIGEIYIWHLDSFENDYAFVSFGLSKEQTTEELMKDVSDTAKKNDIDAFVVDKKINSILSEEINIYAMPNARKYLENNEHIKSGDFSSVFLGKVKVNLFSVLETPDGFIPDTFYLIGDYDNQVSFKRELIDKYGGNFPHPIKAFAEDRIMIAGLWLIVFLFLLLMSFYDISLIKREVIVRMVSGESLGSFVLKNIFKDAFFYLLIFAFLFGVLSVFTVVTHCLGITVIAFIIFIIINSFLYVNMLKTDFRKDVNSKQNAKNTLKISYIYKCAAVVIVILLMSGNILFIMEGIEYYRQKPFFEEHSNYSYINISADLNSEFELNKILQKRLINEQKTFTMVDLQSWGTDVEYVYSDISAEQYLRNNVPEFDSINLNEQKVYFLVPVEYGGDLQIEENMKSIWSGYFSEDFEYEIINCKKTDVLAISNAGNITSLIKRNPIIIFNNLGISSLDNCSNLGYITSSTLFEINQKDFEQFLTEKGVQDELHYLTNAYENYFYRLEIAKRKMIIGLVLLLLVLFINAIITKSMLYYEYSINSVENSLKKLFGYSLVKINFKTILLSAAPGLSATIISTFVLSLLKMNSAEYVWLGGVLILLIDISFVLYYATVTNRLNLQRVLKGGRI